MDARRWRTAMGAWSGVGLAALLSACGGAPLGATAASGAQAMEPGGGVALVELNRPPLLDSMWIVRQEVAAEGQGGADVEVAARAEDPDGDDLDYAWSAAACPGAALAPAGGDPSRVVVHLPDASAGCALELTVTDLWKGGAPPAGSGLPLARGGAATGTLHLAPATAPILAGR